MKIFSKTDNRQFEYDYLDNNGNQHLLLKGKQVDYDLFPLGEGRYSLIKNGSVFLVHLIRQEDTYHVHVRGEYFPVQVEDERQRRLKELVKSSQSGPSEQIIKAPIPGMVLKVNVREGAAIVKGDPLLILEAMKMENIIKAPCDCKVTEIFVNEKEAVQQNQPLIKLISAE